MNAAAGWPAVATVEPDSPRGPVPAGGHPIAGAHSRVLPLIDIDMSNVPAFAGDTVIRIGVLGAARVVARALIAPARQSPGVEIDAVAARSLERAQQFAAAQGIPRAYGSYEELLRDPAIDAVYIALPPSFHLVWVQRALEAGKHVLCEKPLATNAAEAETMRALAGRHGRTLVEAMHTRYQRRLKRQRELALGGTLGKVVKVDACFRAPKIPMAPGDFRLRADMAGGAGLDLGCYAVSCLRYVAGEEPEVISVRRRLAAPGVDRWMRAKLRFPSGAEGVAECGFRGFYRARVALTVTCEAGSVAWDPGGLVYQQNGRTVKEPLPPDWTFQLQLQAFARHLRGDAAEILSLDDSVASARVLDAMYLKSGLGLRQPSTT